MIARALVALVAVAVLAWLGVLERDTRLTMRGVTAAGKLSTPGNLARADRDLRSARLLNPDTTPDFDRVILYQGAGRLTQARAVAGELVRREPDNLSAWALLFRFARDRDPAVAARALAERRRLDPFNARPRAR